MTSETFPYPIPKTGNPISDQANLIVDLTIALGLIETGVTRQHREQGAKIMIELMNCSIEQPANRIYAMTQAKKNIGTRHTE